ncbi:MAG: carboxymuconolactone decarboxylase family protein [bacterium]
MSFDAKTKELIAIGASISAHCQPCLKYHVEKGKKAGLTDKEIAAAIEVGKMVSIGAAGEMDKYINELLNIKTNSVSCGCGS